MLLAADIAQIAAAAASAVARLEEAADENRAAVSQASDAPIEVLIAALTKLLSLLRELEEQRTGREPSPGAPLGPQDIGVLGDYGTDLLSQLSGWARRLNQSALAETFERLSLPLACWIARQGGEIANLVPVVNTAAALANGLRHPPDLERLFLALSEIITAISPSVSQDLDRSNPGRPWRILLINHAIVATRTRQPRLMEIGFRVLAEHLPEDAPAFFREGMEQMHALNYPDAVRRVMQRYFDACSNTSPLH